MQIDAIREQTARILEQENEPEPIISAHWVAFQLPAYKKWFLKKNQQQNYLRVTRMIPPIDNAFDHPSSWICYLQIWVKEKLQEKIRISPEAFERYYNDPAWEKGEIPGTVIVEYAKLKPKQ